MTLEERIQIVKVCHAQLKKDYPEVTEQEETYYIRGLIDALWKTSIVASNN